ncbi:DUF6998 domain-containing protein [Sinorhizobium meliloti]|uniref:DUF6998 domain-containing protein n=1 Tax=Rhizobium meliloti TaxID=382 RepID=A0A2J0YVW5_RHIML|nr:hypothetical protein [Sinorhizobium meliloti]PJR11544.1 hypothetical protein CEJ86_27680 [Sinorhizobium meliloti]
MALNQFEIIKSLGEALSWFERELSWGVPAAELNHLTGRIGELYTAMFTYGQMATEVNQRGYDVVSAAGERISVKTVTSSNQVGFNHNTFEHVDRVVVLKINTEEMAIEILLDRPASEARTVMREDKTGKLIFPIYRSPTQADDVAIADLLVTKQAHYKGHTLKQYENGTVHVVKDGAIQQPALPILREFAAELQIDPLNSTGSPKNTRYLGDQIIRKILELQYPLASEH